MIISDSYQMIKNKMEKICSQTEKPGQAFYSDEQVQ